MKILVVGIGEAPHLGQAFRTALNELGHTVSFLDEREAFLWVDRNRLRSILWRLNGKLPIGTRRFNRLLLETVRQHRPDVLVSVKGTYIAPDTLREIRESSQCLLINYSTDDPFNPAASNDYIVKSLPLWHVYGNPRPANMQDLQRVVTGKLIYTPFGYDPAMHFPETLSAEERQRFGSQLVFIGLCDRDRVALLELLAAQQDIDSHFYGGGRYAYNRLLRPRYRGFANGRNYRLALCGAEIAFSVVRQANRDTHVMRTFEIPACRAFMLSERTEEHLEFFREGHEAEYFSSNEEMLDKIRFYLKHTAVRERIADAGFKRATSSGYSYKDRIRTLLEA